jgi:hypothetical protein
LFSFFVGALLSFVFWCAAALLPCGDGEDARCPGEQEREQDLAKAFGGNKNIRGFKF